MTVSRNGDNQYVLRISVLGDRSENDYLAETEFVRFLAENGVSVAAVIPSVHGNLVEHMVIDAKGILIADNSYRYREGATLSEYFYNTGKALGAIHRLSRAYVPVHPRPDYFDKYNMTYLDRLIPEEYGKLKTSVAKHLEIFSALPQDKSCYGLVHFDLIGNIVDELECCGREGEGPDWEDIEDAAECLIHGITYAGIAQGA